MQIGRQANPFTTGLPVEIQDQYSQIVDVHFCSLLNTVTLASDATADTYTITLVGGHGVVAGDMMCLKQGTYFMQAEVLNVATDVLTLDMPLNYSYTTSATAERTTRKLNVNGSVTPVVFKVSPINTTNQFDITRMQFLMQDNVVMDSSKFGGLTALTNGIVVRKKDGFYQNLFNLKSNSDFGQHCQSIRYEDKAPAGLYEFSATKIFAGQENSGVTIRLDSALSDELQIIVRDDLTGLSDFSCVAIGHVVV